MNDSEARFTITGAVVDKFTAPSGKFGKLKIETSIDGRRTKHEMKTFDAEVVKSIGNLGAGEVVTVHGSITRELLKDWKGAEVKSGDYSLWIPMLKVEAFGSAVGQIEKPRQSAYNQKRSDFQQRTAPKNDAPPVDATPDDDNIPF